MLAFDSAEGPTVVLVGNSDEPGFQAALRQLRAEYAPQAVILPLDVRRLGELPEFFAGLSALDGLPTAYVCRDFVCDLPTTNIELVVHALQKN